MTSQQSSGEVEEKVAENKEESEESNLVLILSLAATGVICVLFGAIAVLLRKKPKQNLADEIGVVHPALENDSSKSEVNESEITEVQTKEATHSTKSVEFVSTWEELPNGEWLPNDEHGVNWYQDEEGRYWHSTDDGFRVWNE